MSSRVRNRLRALATSATSLLVASSMVFALAPAVSAAPTSSETSTATSTSKKNFLDGLSGGKSDEATSTKAPASTVTSINHLRDLFDAPKASITTTQPEDPNAEAEGREAIRNKDGEIVYTGKHTSQTAAEAQGLYCETSDDLTFGGVAHLVEDQLRKLIKDKASMKVFDQQVRMLETAMNYVQLPTLIVSNPATQLTGPAREFDDHGVNYLVGALLKARDGGWRSTVSVQDITINEAVETVLWWFYWVQIYGQWHDETFPSIIQATILGIKLGGLTDPVEKTLEWGPKIVLGLGNFIQKQLQKNCLSKTNSRSNPGNYQYHDLPAWLPKDITDGVHQLEAPLDNVEVADEDCPPISEMNFRRIGKRTTLIMRKDVKPQYRELFDQVAQFVLLRMEEIKVNKALIPLKASEIGGLIGLINNPVVTYVGGTALGVVDGRAYQWIPMGEITVDNAADIAIVSNAVAEIVAKIMWAITKAIMQAVIKGANKGIDKAIRKAIAEAVLGPEVVARDGVCTALAGIVVGGSLAGSAVAPELIPLIPTTLAGQAALGLFCGTVGLVEHAVSDDPATFTVTPALNIRLFPLPAISFGILIPWFGSIPVGPPGIDPTTAEETLGAPVLGDVPIFGRLFKKSKFIQLLTILGLDWDLWVNPIPTMFFAGDVLLPMGQKVTQSVCLAEDKGHRQAKWQRGTAQMEEDAALAEKKGLYEAPKGPNIILFNKWVLPFANPFFKPDYENLNTDVPEREPMIQRHDPNRIPDQLDPDDVEYKDEVTPSPDPDYKITYNRDFDQLDPTTSITKDDPYAPTTSSESSSTTTKEPKVTSTTTKRN